MNMKRLAATVIATCTVALTACTAGGAGQPVSAQSGAPGSSGLTPLTFGLTYIPNVQFAPVYAAEQFGYFTEENLKVTVRHHGGEEGLFTALQAGEEDVVLASGDEVFQAREAGVDIVSIGTYYQKHPVRIIVKADSGINSVADLKGKNIGIPGEYGSNWYALPAFLASVDLSVQDVTVTSIGYSQVPSLQQGHVDAIVGFANNDVIQARQAGLEVTVLGDDIQLPLVSSSIVASREWLEKNGQAATSLLHAIKRGIENVIGDTEAAIELTARHDPSLTGDARTNALLVLNATKELWKPGDGNVTLVQDLDTWEKMTHALELKTHPNVADAVDNSYVMATDSTH